MATGRGRCANFEVHRIGSMWSFQSADLYRDGFEICCWCWLEITASAFSIRSVQSNQKKSKNLHWAPFLMTPATAENSQLMTNRTVYCVYHQWPFIDPSSKKICIVSFYSNVAKICVPLADNRLAFSNKKDADETNMEKDQSTAVSLSSLAHKETNTSVRTDDCKDTLRL